MNMFFRAKRRYKKIKNKFKKIIRTRLGKKIIKISLLTYDITRVVYNPFYLIDILKRETVKSILS